ncbi:fibrinogen-like protein A [Antedon mediterranea]|uniref:fibrinogen-like protein A n=1 Tax=Antedon mediterranea TaxID=105859 RepID=UPI003AF67824
MDCRMLVIGCMLVVMAAACCPEDDCGCSSRKKCFLRDCGEILENDPSARSDDYLIQPHDEQPEFMVYCDMRKDGGWTVIQRREDGSQDFYRDWANYKKGFGNVHSEFWLGNEKINRITFDGHFELLVEVTDHLDEMKFARYSHFRIGSEDSNYTLTISGYTGTAGYCILCCDSLAYANGGQFSTYDTDNDKSSINCAESYKGAWWYKNCANSNLNGLYLTPGSSSTSNGIYWFYFKDWESLKKTVMMVKRAP